MPAGGCYTLGSNKYNAHKRENMLQQHLYQIFGINTQVNTISQNNKYYTRIIIYMLEAQAAIFKLSGEEEDVIQWVIKQYNPEYPVLIMYRDPHNRPFKQSQL